MIKKKLWLFIIIGVVLLLGGVYALITIGVSVTNSVGVVDTKCFDVNYTDNMNTLSGTLWPSSDAGGGLSGSVTFNKKNCSANGRGTLYLNISSSTSSTFFNTVPAHCENKYTLETVTDLINLDCVNSNDNTKWISSGTALKYAVYDSSSRSNIYATGYIDDSFIGKDITILDDFSITETSKTFYVYLWLDGNLSDNTYADLSLNATFKLGASQVKSTDNTFANDMGTTITSDMKQYNHTLEDAYGDITRDYTLIEYIESTGTQYIDTGITPDEHYGFYADIYFNVPIDTTSSSIKVLGSSILNEGRWGGITVGSYASTSGGQMTWFDFGNGYSFKNPYLVSGKRTQISLINNIYSSSNVDNNITYTKNNYSALNGSVYLFAIHSDVKTYISSNLRMYRFKTYNDANVVQDMIPCYRRSDNVLGLFDLVNAVFYTNAGTGSFIAGPEV